MIRTIYGVAKLIARMVDPFEWLVCFHETDFSVTEWRHISPFGLPYKFIALKEREILS